MKPKILESRATHHGCLNMCYLSDVFKQTLRHMWKYHIHWHILSQHCAQNTTHNSIFVEQLQWTARTHRERETGWALSHSISFISNVLNSNYERDMNQNVCAFFSFSFCFVSFWEKPEFTMTHTHLLALLVLSLIRILFQLHSLRSLTASFCGCRELHVWIWKPCALQSILTV